MSSKNSSLGYFGAGLGILGILVVIWGGLVIFGIFVVIFGIFVVVRRFCDFRVVCCCFCGTLVFC